MWRLTPIEDKHLVRALKGIDRTPHPATSNEAFFLKLLALSPASVRAYLQAEAALANGMLTLLQREQIALAVAEINGSNYCVATHEQAARHAGLGDKEILSARNASASDPNTAAMLHFVQAVVLQRGEVSDTDFSTVKNAGFAEAEIIEILTNVILNGFTNYFNLLARTDLGQLLERPDGTARLAAKTMPACSCAQ